MNNELPSENSPSIPETKQPVSKPDEIVTHDGKTSAEQSTENYIETYHAISEWLRFADAKAAVILTVGGALAGFLIPTIHKVIAESADKDQMIPFWKEICILLFAGYIIFFLLSGVFAFLCINPIRSKGKHPSLDHCDHFHPAAISNKYSIDDVQKFVEDCKDMGAVALKREVQAAVLLDSHTSKMKYERVRKSLMHFAVSAAFGFVYFLMAQFSS